MHCCLITAPTVTEFRSRAELRSDAVKAAASEPQLGILSVAATIASCGDVPHIVDANSAYVGYASSTHGLRLDAFAEYLADLATRSNADIYGLSSICSTYPLSIRVARAIKRDRPYATILFGGPQASVVDVATLSAFAFVDYILRGEVEQTLPQLLSALNTDCNTAHIGGLTWRDGNTVLRNQNADVIKDLDDLPPPAYHLTTHLQHAKGASIELGRGCPFSCTFCSTNDFFRRSFRLRSPAKVLADMRQIADTYDIRHFELVHDMFTVDRKRVAAFCDEMLASGEGFTWNCSARTDCVDEDLLDLMYRSGCRGVFFGIETGSERMQRIIDKDLNISHAGEMLDAAERLGMKTTASLITGFPEENWEDLRDTLRVFTHSARCSRSHPQLNILAPLAGTPIHTDHKHEMVLDELCSDMSHQGLSQHGDDLDLIRQHPDIFPNFYLPPVKHLDRDILFDLREFLGMSVELFRWLLCAIDQTTDLLRFHAEWRSWRTTLTGNLFGSGLRRYYAGQRFREDFIRFVLGHRLAERIEVGALAHAEHLLNGKGPLFRTAIGDPLPRGQSFPADATPYGGGESRILAIPHSLTEIVRSVASRTPLKQPGVFFYAVRANADGARTLVEISDSLATVLYASDGTRTVQQTVDCIAAKLHHVDPGIRSDVATKLLEGANDAGFITIHHASSLTPDQGPVRNRNADPSERALSL